MTSFADFGLQADVLRALTDIGYETPTPIQEQAIPILLEGADVIGQAQTGTGKTAAFALPLLSKIDLSRARPQALVLTPTRELALQVAEAIGSYSKHQRGLSVLAVYGGQGMGTQLKSLSRGVHVVVGTPGRIMDHLERKTLDLSELKMLVLDEADEMLRMGFIDDVETILKSVPATRQTALFSATMPPQIKKIALNYLREPKTLSLGERTMTVPLIRQRYLLVKPHDKFEAFARVLESEPAEGAIVFCRTKTTTVEVADKLKARGYSAAALNGDLVQQQREKIVEELRSGLLDVVVATDVAARGLDVERITHVFNFEISSDVEGYVHRIGRTGRAGRAGEAILLISPRERGMLKEIERHTKQTVEPMQVPTLQDLSTLRVTRFKAMVLEDIAKGGLERHAELAYQIAAEALVEPSEVAAALIRMNAKADPLLKVGREIERVEAAAGTPNARASKFDKPRFEKPSFDGPRPLKFENKGERASDDRPARKFDSKFERAPGPSDETPYKRRQRLEQEAAAAAGEAPRRRPERSVDAEDVPRRRAERPVDADKSRMRIQAGREHGVRPQDVVGAIANEGGISGDQIGAIRIEENFTTVDVPRDQADALIKRMAKTWIRGTPMGLEHDAGGGGSAFKRKSPDDGSEPFGRSRLKGAPITQDFRPKTAKPGGPGGKFKPPGFKKKFKKAER
jgi:ATP-dependent RNA helicase DeaD